MDRELKFAVTSTTEERPPALSEPLILGRTSGVAVFMVFKKSDTAVACMAESVTDPAAITLDKSTLEVFVIGADSALWTKVHDVNGAASTSAGWFNLGGECYSAPVVVSWGPKNVSVFVVGGDRLVYCCMWNGSKWDWTCLSGHRVESNYFTACSWGSGRLDVFAIGPDSALKHFVSSDMQEVGSLAVYRVE